MAVTTQSLLTRLAGFRAPGAEASLEELRASYDALFARFGEAPAGTDIAAARLGPIAGEWVRTPASSPARTILYFHGGGYVAGSPESHRPLIARLAEAGEARAFSVQYRLAPECPFPAAVRDGIDAYRHLIGANVPASSVVLSGDGAGGGLALAVLLAVRNAGLAMPGCVAAMSPWADLSLSGWSMLRNRASDTALSWESLFLCARHYLGKANPCDAYASPAFASFKNFPPLMVHAGSAELLRDDASKLGDRAAEAAIAVSVEIYDGLGHLFQGDAKHPDSLVSLARLGKFIRSRTQTSLSA